MHWTATAQRHLDAIHAYISQDSVEYAQRVVDRLTRRSQQIAAFPLSGRKVPEFDAEDVREVIDPPYRIVYRVKPDQVDVLAVIHGARDLLTAEEENGWAELGSPAPA